MKRYAEMFLAYPGEVVRVRIVRLGRDDRNYKFNPPDPVVIEILTGEEKGYIGQVSARELLATALAASIRSAEMSREIETRLEA